MPQHAQHATPNGGPYARLLAMVLLSFIAMYILMYAMVSSFDNVYNSVNQFYMAGLMAAPMAIVELALMASMYPHKRLNIVLIVASAVLMPLSWFGIRNQVAISDQQFLRSMIPHHAGAILMCKENRLTDPELQKLCSDIISSQQREIDEMKSKLK
jgi:uncharacterized protein (DUF305 family)